MMQGASARLARGNTNCPLHYTRKQLRSNTFFFCYAATEKAVAKEGLVRIQQLHNLGQLARMPVGAWYAWHALTQEGKVVVYVKHH